jgi:16S rRNA (guanine(966)-N(2))-methyltransferase RsmD
MRPTSDRLRETLFNVLAPVIEGARFADVCAGTGLVGLEALSRGAAHATFVESDRASRQVLESNVAALGVAAEVTILRADATRLDAGRPGAGPALEAAFDIVFLDPPYDSPALEALLARAAGWLAPGGLLVLEHARRRESPATVGNLRRTRLLEAGDSALSFYRAADP